MKLSAMLRVHVDDIYINRSRASSVALYLAESEPDFIKAALETKSVEFTKGMLAGMSYAMDMVHKYGVPDDLNDALR